MKILIFCAAFCASAFALAQNSSVLNKTQNAPIQLFQQAVQWADSGKKEQALEVLNRLMADFPELPEPYNNAAVLYAQNKQWDKALETLKMAISVHPQFAKAHQNLGFVYLELARQAFQNAHEIAPGSVLKELEMLNQLQSFQK